jgi:hypothetical protein
VQTEGDFTEGASPYFLYFSSWGQKITFGYKQKFHRKTNTTTYLLAKFSKKVKFEI